MPLSRANSFARTRIIHYVSHVMYYPWVSNLQKNGWGYFCACVDLFIREIRGEAPTMANRGRRKPSASPRKPKPKEFSKQDNTCTICLDRLNEPKLLPCFHTYCKACLEGLLRRSPEDKQITCPQCHSIHSLPNGGVGGFSDDRVLENALDFHSFKESQEKSVSLPCSMCTEDDPAIAHCSTCSKFLCESS